MVAHLEAGDLVSVFPEGTRSTDGAVAQFRGGAMLAARLARASVVWEAEHRGAREGVGGRLEEQPPQGLGRVWSRARVHHSSRN